MHVKIVDPNGKVVEKEMPREDFLKFIGDMTDNHHSVSQLDAGDTKIFIFSRLQLGSQEDRYTFVYAKDFPDPTDTNIVPKA